jgi:hypothetical protein
MLSSGRVISGTDNRPAPEQNLLTDQGIGVRQGPGSVLAMFDAALNGHDVDSALALFADDAVVKDKSNIACIPGCSPLYLPTLEYKTKIQIRGWLEELVRDNIEVKELGDYKVDANNVTWVLAISVDEFRRLGVAPLNGAAEAIVREGKISSLSVKLDTESTARLAAAYATSHRVPSSIMASGIGLGVVALGLIFPAAAIYYISRVRSLFASVPWMRRPWSLLEAGVAMLALALLSFGIRNMVGVEPRTWIAIQSAVLIVSTGFFFAAMVMMKRAWTVTEAD